MVILAAWRNRTYLFITILATPRKRVVSNKIKELINLPGKEPGKEREGKDGVRP